MAYPDNLTRMSDGNVALSFSALPATTFKPVGCITDGVTVNDSFDVITRDEPSSCRVVTASLATVDLGARTIEVSFTGEIILSDANYDDLYNEYKSKNQIALKLEAEDNESSPSDSLDQWNGYITQFNRSYPLEGPATFSVVFHVNSITTDQTITT